MVVIECYYQVSSFCILFPTLVGMTVTIVCHYRVSSCHILYPFPYFRLATIQLSCWIFPSGNHGIRVRFPHWERQRNSELMQFNLKFLHGPFIWDLGIKWLAVPLSCMHLTIARKARPIVISRVLLVISDQRTDQQSGLQSRVHATRNWNASWIFYQPCFSWLYCLFFELWYDLSVKLYWMRRCSCMFLSILYIRMSSLNLFIFLHRCCNTAYCWRSTTNDMWSSPLNVNTSMYTGIEIDIDIQLYTSDKIQDAHALAANEASARSDASR